MADPKVIDSTMPLDMKLSNDTVLVKVQGSQSVKAEDLEDGDNEELPNSPESITRTGSDLPFNLRLPTEIRLQIYDDMITTSLSNWKAGHIITLEWVDEYKDIRVASPLRDAATLSLCYESREATMKHGFVKATSTQMYQPIKDVLHVDYHTMKMAEPFQLKVLKMFESIETVAVDWRCFKDSDEIQETLIFLFAYLRNIRHIIMTVPKPRALPFAASSERDARLGPSPRHLLLDYEALPCPWFDIGQEIHDTLKDDQFWADANTFYCFEHIEEFMALPDLPSVTISYYNHPAAKPPREPNISSTTLYDYGLLPPPYPSLVWPDDADAIMEELERPTWVREEDAEADFNKNIWKMI